MSELLPCPICGGGAAVAQLESCWSVACRGDVPACRCKVVSPSRGLAIDRWNRRTPGPDVARLPVGLRVEQISETDAEKLFEAAKSTPDVVGRNRESRRIDTRTPGPETRALELAVQVYEGVSLWSEVIPAIERALGRPVPVPRRSTPGPDVSRLLAAAKAFARKFRQCGSDEHRELCRAIADHEAAHPA